MSDQYVDCPSCSRPMTGTPSGWVCADCGGKLYPAPPQMQNESDYDYRIRIKPAMREAERRRIEAAKKEKKADWQAIRKSLF